MDHMPERIPEKKNGTGKALRSSLSREKAREGLLSASAELFLETGVEKFSLRQAAERAGQSPGNVYNYFKDKDDLLQVLAQDVVQRFNGSQLQAVSGLNDPFERYMALGQAYIRFGMENRAYYCLLQRTDLLMGRVDSHDESETDSGFHLLVGAIQACMDEGRFRKQDVMSLAAFSWAMVHGIVDLCHGPLGSDPRILPAMLDAMNNTLLNGLLNAPNPPSPTTRK